MRIAEGALLGASRALVAAGFNTKLCASENREKKATGTRQATKMG